MRLKLVAGAAAGTAGVTAGKRAARTLARRFQAKMRYRRRRDRKIAVDWIGRDWIIMYTHPLTGNVEWLRVKLTGYNPDNCTVTLTMQADTVRASVTWETDTFWSMLRSGNIREDDAREVRHGEGK